MSERKTLAVVVNGKPLAGKDTFVDFCMETLEAGGVSAAKVSSVDRVKQAAHILGWDGVKDDKGRRFLSDLKDLSGSVYGGPMAYMLETLGGAEVVFYHIREPEEIAAFVEASGGISVLVDRPSQEPLFSNHADQRTHLADYTYTIFNHLDLSYLRSTALAFSSKLVRDYLGKSCTLTKTAADYTPLSTSEVKEIAESVAPPVLCDTCVRDKCPPEQRGGIATECAGYLAKATVYVNTDCTNLSAEHDFCLLSPQLGTAFECRNCPDYMVPPPPSDEWETKDLCRRCGNRRCPMAGRTGATTNCVNYVGMVDLDEPEEKAPAPLSLSSAKFSYNFPAAERYIGYLTADYVVKLREEVNEVFAAATPCDRVIELMDVIHVAETAIRTLAQDHDLDLDDLADHVVAKNRQRGYYTR